MLPSKFKEFIINLHRETELNHLCWKYDDEIPSVSFEDTNYNISIRYSFNPNEEIGQFLITYFDKIDQKTLNLQTTQEYTDYEIVRKLFDSAQTSGFSFSL